MKKNIIALTLLSSISSTSVLAAMPELYGEFNAAIESVDNSDTSNMDIVNRYSHFGFKGSEDLGNALRVIYQLEVEFNLANPTADSDLIGEARNTFFGLAGGFGSVILGRMDTPLRMIAPTDGFEKSAYAGNYSETFNGGLDGEDRFDETFAYYSPRFYGVSFALALSGQENLAAAESTTTRKEQSLSNASSFSLSYGSKRSGFYAAAAYTATGKTSQTGSIAESTLDPTEKRGDVSRAVLQYNQVGLTTSLLYNAQADVGQSVTVGIAYRMGQMTPRAKAAIVNYDEVGTDTQEDSATNYALGLDFSLGKKTRTYVEYASLAKGNNDEKQTKVVTFGLEHKF
ncbi:MAG: porin [Thiomicrospira sp.]|uniref:porin n=1 Tax=Thiomicrospira sp. TaxID=935 RepID=UPI0019DB77CE|nr:porin [Thiomicrospira sp.]MBE0494701.1 porin [Thiomicrospira sp.]